MTDCLFCKIINREIPAEIIFEDEDVLGFKDINPVAPVHVLFIPKKHIINMNGFEDSEAELAGKLLLSARHYARQQGFADDGYRLVFNINDYGGQTVFHTHLHLLSGRHMSWPPG